MKEILTLTIKLLLITAIVAALLGGINMVTEPIIAENNEATFQANLKELLPGAESFELDGTKLPEPEAGVKVNGVYCGMAADGTPVGYVADAVCSEGYGGDVVVMTGVDTEGKITKVKVTEMEETPGLGAKCQTDWIDQYTGLTENIVVSKNGSAGNNPNKIDAISGATITSRAVTKAVNNSVSAAMTVIADNSGAAPELEAPAEGEAVEGEAPADGETPADGEAAEEGAAPEQEEAPADETAEIDAAETEGGAE